MNSSKFSYDVKVNQHLPVFNIAFSGLQHKTKTTKHKKWKKNNFAGISKGTKNLYKNIYSLQHSTKIRRTCNKHKRMGKTLAEKLGFSGEYCDEFSLNFENLV